MKKSFSTFILLVISNLYGEEANVIHANKAPISIQNPSNSKQVETMKHRPIENNSKNSCDSAIIFVIGGSKYLVDITIPNRIQIILISRIHAVWMMLSHHNAENVATIDINSITKISCETDIQTDNLQYVESKSSLSQSNFRITIVELNAVAVPIYNEVIKSNQKRRPVINQIQLLPITWSIHTITVLLQSHWIVAGFNSVHIIKRRNTIHTCEKLFKNSYLLKKFGKIKAMIVHAKI